MEKIIIPHKLIAKLNPDGSVQSAVLQYRISNDGAVEERFYTMAVSAGIKLGDFNTVLSDAKIHVEKGEQINVAEK